MTTALRDKEIEQTPISSGEDDVRQYMQEIRQIPRLSAQEERELAKRCAQGDEDAVRKMVSANLRLVVSVAREYAGRGVPLLDLIQEGSIGLLIAARKFDYTLDYRFSTYATKWIKQGVTRCLANHSQLIRVPVYTSERMRKVFAAKAALEQALGHEPSVEDISEKSGIPRDKVEKYLHLTPETCSLDAPLGDEEDGTLGILLEDVRAVQPQEALVREELKHTVDSMMCMLSQRQQQVLRMHYGMEDGVCHSLEAIGVKLGVSKERIRQIRLQAITKLQKLGASLGLEDFLE